MSPRREVRSASLAQWWVSRIPQWWVSRSPGQSRPGGCPGVCPGFCGCRVRGKDVAEGSQGSSPGRPVGYREYNCLQRPLKPALERRTKVPGRALGIVFKSAASPGTEHKGGIAICSGNFQHTMDAALEQVCGFRLTPTRGKRRGTGEESQTPRPPERLPVVLPKDGNIRRQDRPIG